MTFLKKKKTFSKISVFNSKLKNEIENGVSMSKRKRFFRKINKILKSQKFKIIMITALGITSLISFHTPTRNFVISILNIIKCKLSNVESSLGNTDSDGLKNNQIKNKRALVFLGISLVAFGVTLLTQNGNQSVKGTAQTELNTTGNPEVSFSQGIRDSGIMYLLIVLLSLFNKI